MFSCSQQKQNTNDLKDSVTKQLITSKLQIPWKDSDTNRAKEWLLSNIARFFKENEMKDDTVWCLQKSISNTNMML